MPARGAHLTRVPEVHLDYVPGGLFRFAPEDLGELGRARLVGDSVEPGPGLLPVREEAAGLSGVGHGLPLLNHGADRALLVHKRS
ncbi:MAG: hypothetical protein M0Z34_10095 [Nitrospiraceae bacterium]|nr:hypothetical protein [Nitrospiraceae bacterium]